jgi:hypothetical protein
MSHFSSLGARSGGERRGKWRGEGGLYIGTEGRRLRQELKRIEEGSYDGEETVSGVDFSQRRKTVTWPWQWGPHVSEGEGERGVPVRKDFLGRWPDLELGQIVSPGAF